MIVKTYKQGCRMVELCGKGVMKNDPSQWESCMYRLPKDRTMTDDLIITGGHSVLVDWQANKDQLEYQKKNVGGKIYRIVDKYLLFASVSRSFQKITDTNEYTYYHLVLEDEGDATRHYGIWPTVF